MIQYHHLQQLLMLLACVKKFQATSKEAVRREVFPDTPTGIFDEMWHSMELQAQRIQESIRRQAARLAGTSAALGSLSFTELQSQRPCWTAEGKACRALPHVQAREADPRQRALTESLQIPPRLETSLRLCAE